jgi:hypothetical protein
MQKIWLICELVYDPLGLLRVTTVRIRVLRYYIPFLTFFTHKKAKKPTKPID